MTLLVILVLITMGVLVALEVRRSLNEKTDETEDTPEPIDPSPLEEEVDMNPQCGIGCDNKFCDYVDASVKVNELKDWLNKPCPKCGSNLLTEKDYAQSQLMLKAMKLAQKMTPEQQQKIMSQVDPMQVVQMPMFENLSPEQKAQMKDFLTGVADGTPFDNSMVYISTTDGVKVESVVKDKDRVYKMIRDVNKEECDWLENDIPYNTVLYRYFGSTWDNVKEGCMAVVMEKESTDFFSIPMDAVELVAENPDEQYVDNEDGDELYEPPKRGGSDQETDDSEY